MSTPKHTPGPLSVADCEWVKCKYIVAGKRVIATVHGNASEDYQANANLIASAPELADCLSELLSILRDSTTSNQYTEEKARAAALLERLGM